jgi:hypothetical protein
MLLALAVAAACAGGSLLGMPGAVQAAGPTTLCVDGKTGSDTHDGLSPASAFRTIAKAVNAGYLSTTPSHPSYLWIGTGSYQDTAGPSDTPIGARY